MLTWDDSMSTGDARTDFQHQTLVAKFNTLNTILQDGPAANGGETVGDILDFLEFYAAWHFKQEEALMDKLNCPAAGLNHHEHIQFMHDFAQFKTRWRESNMDPAVAREAHAGLKNWIVDHVLRVDIRMRESFTTE